MTSRNARPYGTKSRSRTETGRIPLFAPVDQNHTLGPRAMNLFESIHIQGFRRLYDVDLKLKPLNVVIGANGCGKTSLLEVFSLLAASASGRLKETLNDLGGIDANLTNLMTAKGDKARCVAFNLMMGVPGHIPLEYRLAVTPQGVAYEISDETLTQRRGSKTPTIKHVEAHHADVRYYGQDNTSKGGVRPSKGGVRPNWDYNQTESALSQVPKTFQEPEDFRKRLASSTHYHVLDVSGLAPIRLPQQMRDAQLPGHDGEDLVSCLYTLRETDPDRFETIEATLRAGFPAFERLNLRRWPPAPWR
jgi:predicted ATPase